ncbi:MAG TPA: lipoprotein insertase outer membrane protein LolB [Methylotenera sp.]|nr:lipoprotein insertase outer membrane protein LolB [Methylotenera sp.]
MNLISKLLIILFVLVATACATRPTIPDSTAPSPEHLAIHQQHLASLTDIQAFSLKGRLGVVTQKQGFSGSIEWQHQPATDNIDVYSPLGSKVANIAKNSNQVVLTDEKGRHVKANDAESLTETTLGFRLPLNGLSDWALGRPAARKIDASSWDAQGRLTALKQDGWDIGFENYLESNGTFLPNKIILKSEKVNLKLLVEQWIGAPI